MSSSYLFYVATLLLAINASAYPTFYDTRTRELPSDNTARDFILWPRREPAPLYGYPDYGDYGNPRPAYTELDIVREQLAHPHQSLPFIKRFPSPPQLPSYDAVEDEEINTNWIENEIPLNEQAQAQMIANNPRLKTLTEALLQALILQQEGRDSLVVPEYAEEDNDAVAQELKTAVKKSAPPALPTPVAIAASADVSTSNDKKGHFGQKEIPLLRPSLRPTASVFPVESIGSKKSNGANAQQKFTNFPRYVKKNRQRSTLVTSNDDLTKELNNLKKMAQ